MPGVPGQRTWGESTTVVATLLAWWGHQLHKWCPRISEAAEWVEGMAREAVIWEVFMEVVLEDLYDSGMKRWTKGPSREVEREEIT